LFGLRVLSNFDGDVIGFVKHLFAKPVGYLGYVHCAGIPGMDRTEKLQNDMERTGVEKNLRNRWKNLEGGKRPFHQS